MSEKYIRVEDAIHMLESTGTLCGFGKYLPENPPSYCPTYSPADILAGQWVPVSERLPEHTGDTLVIVGVNRNGLGMFNEIRVANYNLVFAGWTVYETNHSIIGDVTHWMPLPQPPKEANYDHS